MISLILTFCLNLSSAPSRTEQMMFFLGDEKMTDLSRLVSSLVVNSSHLGQDCLPKTFEKSRHC